MSKLLNQILQSKKAGPYIVEGTENGLYLIRFLDTNYCTRVGSANAYSGRIKDPLHPSVCGVGYFGIGPLPSSLIDASGKKRPTPTYQLWSSMIRRCYSTKENRPTYAGVTVAPRWLCFQSFAADIKTLPGYADWVAYHAGEGGEVIELDKDILCGELGVREYGPETCQFITKSENMKEMWARRKASTENQEA